MGWVFQRDGEYKSKAIRSDYDALAGIRVNPGENPYNNYIRWGVWGRPTLRPTKFGYQWNSEEDILRYRLGRFGAISDGLSNTIMVVERGGRPFRMVDGNPEVKEENPNADYCGQVGWSASNSLSWRLNTHNVGINHDNCLGIYSDHAGGAYVALGDGSVTFLSKSTEITTLAKMIGPSDGEH